MAGQIEPIARMAQQLSRLPGIGAKTAQRLAYHIVSLPEDQVHELASAIWQGRKAVKYCSICGNYTVEDPCPICADERRHNGVICVVRDPRDVAAMERMRDFKGCYHVLHGTISPMEGVGPEDIRIRELLARVGKEDIHEVILATNPDIEGEATASYIARLLKPMGILVTRIAHHTDHAVVPLFIRADRAGVLHRVVAADRAVFYRLAALPDGAGQLVHLIFRQGDDVIRQPLRGLCADAGQAGKLLRHPRDGFNLPGHG